MTQIDAETFAERAERSTGALLAALRRLDEETARVADLIEAQTRQLEKALGGDCPVPAPRLNPEGERG